MADNPLSYSSFVSPDDSIQNLIKQLEEAAAAYAKLIRDVQTSATKLNEQQAKTATATEEGQKANKKAAEEAERLKAQYEGYNKAMKEAEEQAAKLKKALDEQTKATKKAREEADRLKGKYEELTEEQAEQVKQQGRAKKARKATTTLLLLEAKAADAAEGSYDRLSAEYSIAKIKLNAMSGEQRNSTEAGQEAEKQAAELYKEMVRLQEATGKHTLSVGDYGKSWRTAVNEMGAMPGAAGAAAGSLDVLKGAFNALARNPLLIVLTSIVSLLALLGKAFAKSKNGSRLLAKGMAVLEGIFNAVVAVVDELAGLITSLFDDTIDDSKIKKKEGAIEGLKSAFFGWWEGVKAVGGAMKEVFSGDLEAAQKRLQEGVKKQNELFRESARLLEEAAKRAAAVVRMTTELEKAQVLGVKEMRKYDRAVAKANIALAEKTALAEDDTKGMKTQAAALKQSAILAVTAAELDTERSAKKLALLNKELLVTRISRAEETDILNKVAAAEIELQEKVAETSEKRRAIGELNRKFERDVFEQNLDYTIDYFDKVKSLNEARIKSDSTTEEEKQTLLERTKTLASKSFSDQLNEYKIYTDDYRSLGALINIDDAKTLKQRVDSYNFNEIANNRLLEILKERKQVIFDLGELEKEAAEKSKKAQALKTKSEQKAKDDSYSRKLDQIEQQKEFNLSEIELMQKTEAEKTKLRLTAEKERLEAILKLNLEYGDKMSVLQKETLKNQIKALQNEIGKVGEAKEGGLLNKVGIKLDDEEKEAVKSSMGYAKQAVTDLVAARVEASAKLVEQRQTETESAQTAVEKEIEASRNGYANQAETAQKRLLLAQQAQKKAEEEQAKAQKRQQRLQSLEQAGNLVTASAKIWAQFGFPFALLPLAAMWGSFAASKVRAKQATKTFAKGGLEFLEGPSHAAGGIDVGTNAGRELEAQGGESMIIVNKANTAKYKNELPGITNALNSGIFEQKYAGGGYYDVKKEGKAVTVNLSTGAIESELKGIRTQGERQTYVVGDTLVTKYKNRTTIKKYV